MSDWWGLLAGLFRRIWIRAIGDDEPTTSDGEGVPGGRVPPPNVTEGEFHGERLEEDEGSAPHYAGADEADRGSRADGVWIELEIEPLFPSSEAQPRHLVDLTEDNESEPAP